MLDIKSLKGLTQDSRGVKKGFLFAAFPGSKMDGRNYIQAAIENGAVAILAPTGTPKPDADVVFITDDNPRRRFAKMAAEFYGQQPENIIAVTGTNGKTSCVHFVKQLWKIAGYKAASIGTLGVRGPDMIRSGSMTTPDTVSLHATLADMAAVGVTHLAMEASSHGLDQYRLDGVKINAAGFTNLSRDHLDYHENMGEYLNAKSRLFADLVQEGGTAVLNADIEEYAALEKVANECGLDIISYGEKGEHLKLLNVEPHPHGQILEIEVFGQSAKVDLPLVGSFQAMNVLCSLGLVLAHDRANQESYIAALPKLQGAPGRVEYVPAPNGQKGAVYVDYAHTPDALETVLEALRPHTKNRLICIFGCGGARDRGKRPLMGKIACDLSDVPILTDDNPRTEEPELIRADVMAGCVQGRTPVREIAGRRAAIMAGVKELQEGDVLLIAGKGHEQGQIFADHTDPFDDREEAQKAMQELNNA